jgi:hypothetical protein
MSCVLRSSITARSSLTNGHTVFKKSLLKLIQHLRCVDEVCLLEIPIYQISKGQNCYEITDDYAWN